MSTVSGAEFNREPSRVKRSAADGPVVITEHGRPSFVLLTYAEYERLRAAPENLADWLEADDDIEFEIEQTGLDLTAAELSLPQFAEDVGVEEVLHTGTGTSSIG